MKILGIGTLAPQVKILQFSMNILRKLVDLEYFTPGKNYLLLFADLGRAFCRGPPSLFVWYITSHSKQDCYYLGERFVFEVQGNTLVAIEGNGS